jgi:hypothetical protein
MHNQCPVTVSALGTVQYLLKGRAGGKAKFDGKKLPALRSIK